MCAEALSTLRLRTVIVFSCWLVFLFWFLLVRPSGNHDNNDNNKNNNRHRDQPIATTSQQPQQPMDPPIKKQNINSCNDVVVSLQQLPLGNSPYPFLADLMLVGGTLLVPHHPLANLRVEEDQYLFFQACVPDETEHHHYHNIQVSVAPSEGDPDLFISATKPQPTLVDSTWLSKTKGGETITLPSNHADFPPGARTLYIGVRSRQNRCTFTISIDIKDRKNKYQGLRLRRDDVEGLKDMEHETWHS